MSSPSDPHHLARDALARGTALLAGPGRERHALDPAVQATGTPAEPLLGLRCGPSVRAVAYPAEVAITAEHGPAHRVLTIGIAVDRSGQIGVATPAGQPHLAPERVGNLTVDLGLRALGLPTPAPDRPVACFVDGTWLDHVLELALVADLGDPPRWREISRLHPLAGGTSRSPDELRHARAALDDDWEALRRSVARAGRSGPLMSAAVAQWCDAGAFARRMLATVPDPAPLLADLEEILRPRDAARVRTATQPALRAR